MPGQMSFDDIREMVRNAICAKEGTGFGCYIEDLYPDAVVYSSCGADNVEKYYRRSYSIVDEQVALGDAVEVREETKYVPVQAAAVIVAASANDTTGSVWRVRVIGWGPDLQGRINWQREPLVAALAMFEGAKVFALNDSQHRTGGSKFGKSPRELVGALTAAEEGADGIYANLVIMPSASWLQQDLKACAERNIPYVYGLSVDVGATTKKTTVAGKQMLAPVKISSVQVDVVYDPVGKGEFLQQLAAARQAGQEEDDMLKKLLAALQKTRPDLHTEIETGMQAGTMNEDQALEKIVAAMSKTTDTAGITAAVAELKQILAAGATDELKEVKLIACGLTLDRELAASKLPDAAQENIRAAYTGKVFETADLQEFIKSTKEMVDKLTASGQVIGAGAIRATVGYDSVDKMQAAMDKMLGVQVADDLRTIPGFVSLQAAYVEITGDSDLTFAPVRKLRAAYDSTSFQLALGNSMHRRIVQDYRSTQDYGLSLIVGGQSIRNAVDFRPLESFVVGYYGDLPSVNTDIEDYPDLGSVGEDAVEYALMEQGGTLRVTRRMLINNDLNLINRILARVGRGAKRGEARKAWTPLLTNATYKGDGKAIFHVDHGNLGSAAYSVAAALAAKTAMAQQTEPDSGERFPNRPVSVSFPTELYGIVSNVNTYQPQAVTVDNANPMFGFFKPEGLFENSLMTDPSDWLMLADPNEVEIVEMAYLNGQREPQFFIASDPNSGGQMFLNGSIVYRVSHDYNAEVIDYRGMYMGRVA